MNVCSQRLFLLLGISLVGISSGCLKLPNAGPGNAAEELLAVTVSKPIQREVSDYVDYTGRTDAVNAVDIRARVTGYLVKMQFKEGADVKAGDVLFEIDRRPYQAQHDRDQGQVKLNDARLKLAEANLARGKWLASKDSGAITRQELDTYEAGVLEAQASLDATKSTLEVDKLNLLFAHVVSPIDGQVSRYYLTPGNLVIQDQTLLTTVVSLDPMYVYFDMDEPTLLNVRRLINEGKVKQHHDGTMRVLMGLQGEDGYPHQGTINFINNQVNPQTGSISVRGLFENPKPEGGTRLLSPGMFVRIRLPIGDPHPALLVIDRAIGSDQGIRYLYVVDDKNMVQYKRVSIGALQADGLRVITAGLKPDDWVAVGRVQQIRPKMEVRPDKQPMPSLAAQPVEAEKDPGKPVEKESKTPSPKEPKPPAEKATK